MSADDGVLCAMESGEDDDGTLTLPLLLIFFLAAQFVEATHRSAQNYPSSPFG
jgi:hypothetical protein